MSRQNVSRRFIASNVQRSQGIPSSSAPTVTASRVAAHALRKGFTLLEVMLVMGIIIILVGLSAVALMNASDDANDQAAQIRAGVIAQAVKAYKIRLRVFPSKLQDLIEKPANAPNWKRPFLEKLDPDPWGNPYMMNIDTVNNKVVIYSFGQDGAEGGGDDISNEGM